MIEKRFPATAEEDGRSVTVEVRILTTLIRRRVDGRLCRSPEAGGERLHRSQAMVLDYLYEHQEQPVFQRDVEAHFHISRSTATGVIQNMEKNGLLTREPVAYDARLKKLTLTEKACAMHTRFLAALADCEQALRQRVGREDLATFFRVAELMKENLTEEEKQV